MVNNDYDSILTATDSNLINKTDYYKVGKGLPDQGIPLVERPYAVAKDDYLLGGMFLMLLVIAILLYRGRLTIIYHLKEFFTTKRTYSKENMNENNHEVYSNFMLTSISALSLSLVVFNYIAMKIGFDRALGIPYWLFAAGYIVFVVFVYVKAWMYALVNWTFFDRESGTKWMNGYLLLTSLTSFLIFPISLVTVLTNSGNEIVTWSLAFVFFLYEVLLFFKMFVNFKSKKYGYLLIFLYFCSVELVPALILISLTSWAIDNFLVKILY